MNDRELLEKAALAIGREFEPGFTETFWNPLKCDKDAFRLMVELNLNIQIYKNRVMIEDLDALDEDGDEVVIDEVHRNIYIDEPYCYERAISATRRAITRAAAAIGDKL